MRLDDRTTDSKAHAHPFLFRREKGFEYSVQVFNAASAIADLDLDSVIVWPVHTHPHDFVALQGVHCVHPVPNEVDQDLLDLDAIEWDRREVAVDIDVDRYPQP